MCLVVNAPGERVRFRYLHMHPKKLDSDGMVNGRKVREGETLGQVGNFDKISNGTTYHLHFDLQVPTASGWVFVNPYMTLVASYERLIGGRGREISDDIMIAAPATPAAPESAAENPPAKSGNGETSKPVEAAESVDPAAARLDATTYSVEPMQH
jgi:murein DD-endopeptidase MepM/ murein hydrolase activator NlpD